RLTGRTSASHATASRRFSRDSAMRSLSSTRMPSVAVDCNDHPSAVFHSNPAAAGTYGCEMCHLGLIVADHNDQNENKSLSQLEIGQNKKKIGGLFRRREHLAGHFSRNSRGTHSPWTAESELKAAA